MPTSAFGVKPPSRAYARVAIGEMNDSGDVCEDESATAHAVAAVETSIASSISNSDRSAHITCRSVAHQLSV
jgi:hypothetical protein